MKRTEDKNRATSLVERFSEICAPTWDLLRTTSLGKMFVGGNYVGLQKNITLIINQILLELGYTNGLFLISLVRKEKYGNSTRHKRVFQIEETI